MTSRLMIACLMLVATAPGWSCDRPFSINTPEDELFQWPIVFEGRFIDARWQGREERSLFEWAEDRQQSIETHPSDISDQNRCIVRYRVLENFKGMAAPIAEISYLFLSAEECLTPYVDRQDQVVVGQRDDNGQAFASLCDFSFFEADELREPARRLRAEMRIW